MLDGEGVATRKYDGACCLVRGSKLFKRYEVGRGKKPPAAFEAASEVDPATGKQQGWLPVGDGPEDRWFREAMSDFESLGDGTYELVGPKVQGNPENFGFHTLVRHGRHLLHDCPRDYAGLKAYLDKAGIEGVVWHHDDGRMVKIKAKDFGLVRIPF